MEKKVFVLCVGGAISDPEVTANFGSDSGLDLDRQPCLSNGCHVIVRRSSDCLHVSREDVSDPFGRNVIVVVAAAEVSMLAVYLHTSHALQN